MGERSLTIPPHTESTTGAEIVARTTTTSGRPGGDPPRTSAPRAPSVARQEAQSSKGKWWVLVAMVFGLFMPMLDNLVVNVALPTVQRTLQAQVSDLQWIIDAYTLTFASFMLTGGSLGDLFGRKRFFIGGLVLFTLGSLACGLSTSTEQLIAFRAVQGLGAALLLPGSLSILTATFRGPERGAAIGIWAAMSGLAVAVGPLVGGYLVEHHSWESIFFINIPVGLMGLLLTAFVVRESKDPTRSRRVDLPGLITGTAGLFFLVYGLIEGSSRGWTDDLILGAFGLAAVLLTVFTIIEAKRKSPMLPLGFFRNPTFAASNVVAAAVFFALFGVTFFLVLYLQNVRGFSPLETGVRLLPFTAVMLVVSPIAGKLSDRHGSRGLMTIGCALAAAGMGLLLRTEPDSAYSTVIFPAFIVLGVGLSLTMAPMTAAVMASVEIRHAGVASAATNTTRELGGVFGIALLGAIVTSAFKDRLLTNLLSGGIPDEAARSIVDNASSNAAAGGGSLEMIRQQMPQGTPDEVIDRIVSAAQSSFVESIHTGMLIAIGFMLLASLVALIFVRSHVAQGEIRSGLGVETGTGAVVQGVPPAPNDLQTPNIEERILAPSLVAERGPPPVAERSTDDHEVPERVFPDPMGSVAQSRLKKLLFELPFKAGTGNIQQNLTEIVQATLLDSQNVLPDEERATLAGGAESLYGSTRYDISVIAGYLVLEQRFGRINPKVPPEQAATLLMGAARALGLEAVARLDNAVSQEYLEGMVKILLEGIGTPDGETSPGNDPAAEGQPT